MLERRRSAEIQIGATRRTLEVVGPDDLVVFKVSCNQGKDWVDIEAMLVAGTVIDLDLKHQELLALRGPTMLPRIARLSTMLENAAK